jgi:hypothetical protein
MQVAKIVWLKCLTMHLCPKDFFPCKFKNKIRYCLSWWKKTKHLCVYPIWQNVIMHLQALLCGCQMLIIFLHLRYTFWELIDNQKHITIKPFEVTKTTRQYLTKN